MKGTPTILARPLRGVPRARLPSGRQPATRVLHFVPARRVTGATDRVSASLSLSTISGNRLQSTGIAGLGTLRRRDRRAVRRQTARPWRRRPAGCAAPRSKRSEIGREGAMPAGAVLTPALMSIPARPFVPFRSHRGGGVGRFQLRRHRLDVDPRGGAARGRGVAPRRGGPLHPRRRPRKAGETRCPRARRCRRGRGVRGAAAASQPTPAVRSGSSRHSMTSGAGPPEPVRQATPAQIQSNPIKGNENAGREPAPEGLARRPSITPPAALAAHLGPRAVRGGGGRQRVDGPPLCGRLGLGGAGPGRCWRSGRRWTRGYGPTARPSVRGC